MSLLRQVAHNTAWQFLGKTIGTGLGFVCALIVLRYLGDEKYGNYTSAMTYLQLFGIVMDLGLYVILLKYIDTEKNKDNRLFYNIFTFRLVTAIGFLLLACSSVWLIPVYPRLVQWAVVVTAVNFLCITLNQLFLGVYQSKLATAWVALAEICGKAVMLGATLYVVYVWQAGLLAVMLTVVLSGIMQTTVLMLGLRRYTKLRLAFDFPVWRAVFKESWPIALAIALNLIYFKSDTFILGLFHSQVVVGLYGAPYKMLEVLITLPAIVVGLLMPVLGQSYNQGDLAKFKQLYQRAINLLLMIAVPMLVGVMLLAQPLMLVIAGEDFTATPGVLGELLRILIIAVGMIFVGTLTGYVIVIINKQRQILFGYGFVAVTAFIGYLTLIPTYSYYGAAWVTVYSETMMVLIAGSLIYRVTGARPQLLVPLKIIGASAMMGGMLWWFQTWPLWILIPLAMLMYGLMLVAVRGITIAELKTVLRLHSA